MKTIKTGFITVYLFLSTFLFAQTEWTYTSLPCPGGIPNCLYMDRKTEDVYVGCYGGVWKLDQTTNQWSLVDGGIQDSSILANAKITALYLDKSGVFYAGCDSNTPSYISYNSGKTWQPIIDINFTLLTINCIVGGPDGSVLLGTSRKVLNTPDHGKTWLSVANSPSFAYDFAVDSSKNIWAAVNGGVYKSTDNGATWIRKSNGMLGVTMTSIEIESNSRIWVGADGDLYRSDDNGENWISTRRIQYGGHIFDVTIDRFNVVYFACEGQYNYINYTSDLGNSFIQFPLAPKMRGRVRQLFVNNKCEIYTRQENGDIMKWVFGPTQVFNTDATPRAYYLSQNYPNPFNPTTTIDFSIPSVETFHGTSLQHVVLKVYDLLGREVTTLVDEEKAPGDYEVTFNVETAQPEVGKRGESLPSGVYFYNLTTGSNSITKKMLLMK